MAFRTLPFLRKFSTSQSSFRPYLSDAYKSKDLWAERSSCKLLNDEKLVASINEKIITNNPLSSLELDVFVNIASPRTSDTAQLKESIHHLAKLRQSLYANTILPSTSHAIARLFLDSERLESLVHIVGDRVKFGLFPDYFVMNLMLEEALSKENSVLATKLASYVMLQEEFGTNHITDVLAIISVTKYLQSKTDFADFTEHDTNNDPILAPEPDKHQQLETAKRSQERDDDDEEEEAEYIRVPFLRNPYCDNHFDLKDPRAICGKTLRSVGKSFANKHPLIYQKAALIGEILLCNWPAVKAKLEECIESNTGLDQSDKSLCQYYIENLKEPAELDNDLKSSLLTLLDRIPDANQSLVAQSEDLSKDLTSFEEGDIQEFRSNLTKYSEIRNRFKEAQDSKKARDDIIAEIKAKKEELRLKEQFLYFYDNLKKKSVRRIIYE